MKPVVSMSHRETAAVLLRSLQFVREMPGRFAIKVIAGALALTPVWLLPYPAKVVVDHLILKIPVEQGKYPWFFRPFVDTLRGATSLEMIAAICALVSVTLILFGGWSTVDQQRLLAVGLIGQNSTGLAEGNDVASRAQNVASAGSSWCGGLVGWFEYQWNVRLSQEINHRLRTRIFARIQRLPMTQLDDQRIGDAIYRLMYDTPAVSEICNRLVFTPILTTLNIAVVAYLMALQFPGRWTFLWIGLGVIPVALLITVPMSGVLRRTTLRARAAGSATTSTLEESVSNVLAVQALGAQHREREHFDADSSKSYREARRLYVIQATVIWIAVVVSMFGMGSFVYFDITDGLFAGDITVGDVGVLMAFYTSIIFGAREIGVLWYALQDAAVGAKRAFELLDAPVDLSPAGSYPLPTVRQGYRFENVSFAYPDGTLALRGIDLEAKRGTMVALVGPAGAGKTSLAYLLPRFLTPTSGRVLVDGHDLAGIDRDALRGQIAFVFQEPVLFDATVAENIRIGKPDATDAELKHAAEIAGAAEFIERMPEKYATRLGRGGGRLSVGQKQRLSIARALVRGAPVLVLDEPTAALDPETELHLVNALREASRDRLVIVIAHRLSTIRHADQIVFLDEGTIRERGSHAQLMARPAGAYRQFVELQAGSPSAG